MRCPIGFEQGFSSDRDAVHGCSSRSRDSPAPPHPERTRLRLMRSTFPKSRNLWWN